VVLAGGDERAAGLSQSSKRFSVFFRKDFPGFLAVEKNVVESKHFEKRGQMSDDCRRSNVTFVADLALCGEREIKRNRERERRESERRKKGENVREIERERQLKEKERGRETRRDERERKRKKEKREK
jgi:hypothetical protein